MQICLFLLPKSAALWYRVAQMEYLDIISESDQIIGSKPRSEVHRDGFLHREIHVWLFDEDGNIYFQKRPPEAPSAGLLDATVGGHVRTGETYTQALVRKTQEETGVSSEESGFVFLGFSRNKEVRPRANKVNNFLRASYVYKQAISPNDLQPQKETTVFEYIHKDELESKLGSYAFKENFCDYVLSNEIPWVLKYLKGRK